MSKKLLQINSVVNTGSTGRIAEDIGKRAIEQGWESYIAYGREAGPSKSQLIRIGNDWDIKVHGFQTRLFDRHGLGSKSATHKLIKKIKEIKPDIIHLHNIHGYYLNIKVLFNFLSKLETPIIWTLHDCWPITGHCAHFDLIGCEKWKTQCKNCPQTKSYPSSFLIDGSIQNFNLKKELFTNIKNLTIVPVSKWLASIVQQSFLKDFPINVIHNGIDINIFKPAITEKTIQKYKLQGKFVLLGVAGIWNANKGLNNFIELSNKLGTYYQIILVGLTKKQTNALPSNIIGIERTENLNELAQLYSISDVFVNPSFEDTFPTTNLEALACGTPVITYNTGGSPEAIDFKTGIVVEKGNINDLHTAILEVQKNGKAYYSESCRERAVKNYNKDDRFDDYIQLYASLMKKI